MVHASFLVADDAWDPRGVHERRLRSFLCEGSGYPPTSVHVPGDDSDDALSEGLCVVDGLREVRVTEVEGSAGLVLRGDGEVSSPERVPSFPEPERPIVGEEQKLVARAFDERAVALPRLFEGRNAMRAGEDVAEGEAAASLGERAPDDEGEHSDRRVELVSAVADSDRRAVRASAEKRTSPRLKG